MAILRCHLVFSILTLSLAYIAISTTSPTPNLAPKTIIIYPPNLHLLNASIPVNTTEYPDWAGDITVEDCGRAVFFFRGRIASYNPDKKIIFWTAKSTVRPESEEFELPFGYKFKSCIVLLRMAKDYGDETIPTTRGGFFKTSNCLSKAAFTWNNVLGEFDGMLARMRYEEEVRPVWTLCGGVEGYNAIVMFVPRKSVMATIWAADIRGFREWAIFSKGDGNGGTTVRGA